MPKKKRASVAKSGPVWYRSAEQVTLDNMPKYNAHVCKTGPHGAKKYDRAKLKRDWQRELKREGVRNSGRLPFWRGVDFGRINPASMRTGQRTTLACAFTWSRRQESNPQPPDYKSDALPLSHAGITLLEL